MTDLGILALGFGAMPVVAILLYNVNRFVLRHREATWGFEPCRPCRRLEEHGRLPSAARDVRRPLLVLGLEKRMNFRAVDERTGHVRVRHGSTFAQVIALSLCAERDLIGIFTAARPTYNHAPPRTCVYRVRPGAACTSRSRGALTRDMCTIRTIVRTRFTRGTHAIRIPHPSGG